VINEGALFLSKPLIGFGVITTPKNNSWGRRMKRGAVCYSSGHYQQQVMGL